METVNAESNVVALARVGTGQVRRERFHKGGWCVRSWPRHTDTRPCVCVCVCVCVCARLGNGWKIDNGVAGPGRSIPPCLLARDFPPKISQSVDNRRAPSISRRSPLSSQTVPLRFHVSLSSFLAIAFTYPRDDISSDDDTIG